MIVSKLRATLYTLFVDNDRSSELATKFDHFMTVIMLVSVGEIVAESLGLIPAKFRWAMPYLDAVTMGLITLDYVGRWLMCVDDPKFGAKGQILGRLYFMITPMAIVDFVSTAPYFLDLLGLAHLRFLLFLRFLRILKLARYSPTAAAILAALPYRKTYVMLFIDQDRSGRVPFLFDMFMTGVMLVSILEISLEAILGVGPKYVTLVHGLEGITMGIIALDYLARVWLCVEDPKYGQYGWFLGRLRFIVTPLALVDFASTAPYFLELLGVADLRFFLILRFLRVLKLIHYSPTAAAIIASLPYRKTYYTLFIEPNRNSRATFVFDMFMTTVMLISVLEIVLEALIGVSPQYRETVFAIEGVTMAFITLDYFARIWLCVDEPKYGKVGPVLGRLMFMVTPMALIDFASTAPYFIDLFGLADVRFLLFLRLLRIIKLVHYSPTAAAILAAIPKRQTYYTLFIEPDRSGPVTFIFDAFMTVVLFISVGTIVADTVKEFSAQFHEEIMVTDAVTMGIITLDYLGRLWMCTEDSKIGQHGSFWGRLRFIVSPLGIIDIVSIAPYYLDQFDMVDLRFLLTLRMLRVLKLARYSPALTSVMSAVIAERRALMASLFLFAVMLTLISGIMYHLEGDVQPDAFGSIPKAMWWAIVTLTTVGYGDVVPTTAVGKMFAGMTGIIGIVLTAIPSGIMASSFATELKKRDFVVSCKLIAKVPFFHDLDSELIAEIAGVLKTRVFPPHHVLVHKGERGDRIYFLADGEAQMELDKGTINLKPGDYFGEQALLNDEPRAATVVTISECHMMYLEREPFLNLLDTQPIIRATVERIVHRRLGHASGHAAGSHGHAASTPAESRVEHSRTHDGSERRKVPRL